MADQFADVIGQLDRKPTVIGHSFGGLLTQMVAGRGLSAVSVAIVCGSRGALERQNVNH